MVFTKNVDELVDMFNSQKINLTTFVKKTLRMVSTLLNKNKVKS